MSVIRIEGLRHGFGPRTVLSITRWSVAAGEIALVMGPSGSGKTTLLYLVGGLMQPQAGLIEINGVDISAMTPRALDRLRGATIGVVFQDLRLLPSLSVRANLWVAARLAGRSAKRRDIHDALERLDVAHCADMRPRALSQGEAQRAAIARALIARPKVLLADEPTSALDDDNAS
ncbi:MAG: ATP-binding cassette domain-containing protein, partial [Caulobacterales bacterium]|nr:ATP-binding cassette domain-containing protein [Caulobacterales bacterium]